MKSTFPTLFLKPGRERSVQNRHPWIFDGAVARIDGSPGNGAVVQVCDARGAALAWAHLSLHSKIRARVLDFAPDAVMNENWWRRKIAAAISRRNAIERPPHPALSPKGEGNAVRLIFAEADGLPGLIVDQFGEFLVVQFQTAGMDAEKNRITNMLAELLKPRGIFERSEEDSRAREGLGASVGVLYGETPPANYQFREGDLQIGIDIAHGQKTGWYLDQRVNRARVRAHAAEKNVLDAFSYTGGFALAALHGGATHVTRLDASAAALAQGTTNLRANHFAENVDATICGDAFDELRTLRAAEKHFDLIILDPPKFAASKHEVDRALRGYKDINLQALQLLTPGGLLATFSCSGNISAEQFQIMLYWAAKDAQCDVQIIERFTQSDDHPVLLTFPESEYLKGLLVRKV